jgi:hypothetical protein
MISLLAMGLAATVVTAQVAAVPAESKQFDFWVGSWRCEGLAMAPDGKQNKQTGTNRVTREMKGHVVHEHFQMGDYKGESWSVYEPRGKRWRQTWVDDNGGYIALYGEFKDGVMILRTPPDPTNPKAWKRMRYHNIKSDGFDWDWEGTQDEGATWKSLWHLRYVRTR